MFLDTEGGGGWEGCADMLSDAEGGRADML
jgi:hypothetical protein